MRMRVVRMMRMMRMMRVMNRQMMQGIEEDRHVDGSNSCLFLHENWLPFVFYSVSYYLVGTGVNKR